MHSWCKPCLATLLPALALGQTGVELPHTFIQDGPNFQFTVYPKVGYYFGFQTTEDLGQQFITSKLALGDTAASYSITVTPELSRFFVRAEAISVFAPRDSDNDGMDDLWELAHPYLNPLNANDAAQSSPNLAGVSNLEEYRSRFGLSAAKAQYYGREVSLFNFGAPSASFEAISREQSIFNFGSAPFSVEALGREVTIFNGERPAIAGYPEAYSREQSVFNFGAAPFTTEALGRELTVYNGERPAVTGYPEAYSREVSLFNFGAASASVEAVSREVSLFNDIH